MINTRDFNKIVMNKINSKEFNEKNPNEKIQILNSIIKEYTVDKLTELGEHENSEDVSLMYLLHLLSHKLKEEQQDEVFANYIYTLLTMLGKLQKCGIVFEIKKDKNLNGMPKTEIDNDFNVSSIEVDESCKPVDNTIYVHKMLIKEMRK